MRLVYVLAIVAALAMATQFTRADDQKSGATTITGVLIDQACGAKMMTQDDPEKAAESHPRACAMKEDFAKSGYAVISGKTMYKFDDKGNDLAKDFLKNSTKDSNLRAAVEGNVHGDQIDVTSIKAVD